MTSAGFLIAHGSALILPLAVVEGPVVSIVTGFLVARGFFAWYWALTLLVCGDVIGDVMYYWVGRGGVTRLAGLGRWFGVNAAVPQGLQRDLRDNATRMLLVGKWTHSVGFAVLVGSGMLRLPLARFILVNLLASVPKSGVLLGLGYFAGDHLAFFESHLVSVAIVLCTVGVAAIGLILRRADAMRAGQ